MLTVLIKTGAGMARHRSKQDYSTPNEFLWAVESRFGKISFDLAADEQNKKAPSFYSVEEDSLKQDWHSLRGLLFLNPPFNDIAPWAEKCDYESNLGARILFLTPASVGSNWFADHVHRRARVYAIRPRLSFDGKNPYPKDCILSYYSFGTANTFETWKWK